MGVARLLAKGWVVFCLFAGAHALVLALRQGEPFFAALAAVTVCVVLFAAMGLLFVGGFGASFGSGSPWTRIRPRDFKPDFNEIVFVAFLALSFALQAFFVAPSIGNSVYEALQRAIYFAVPGQIVLARRLLGCQLGPHILRMALNSAFTWLLAIIFVASAVSRIGLTAGLLRLERMRNPSAFGLTLLAAIYGFVAIVGFQLFYVGSIYPWLGCAAFIDVAGAVLTGLLPLLLAYLIVAALATLKASGPPT